VTKRDPFGPYKDMSKDRALLDVVDEIKKIDQSRLCSNPDSRPIEKAVLRVSVPGGRRRRRNLTRRALRRYVTKRKF
jgi:hypothetical protein